MDRKSQCWYIPRNGLSSATTTNLLHEKNWSEPLQPSSGPTLFRSKYFCFSVFGRSKIPMWSCETFFSLLSPLRLRYVSSVPCRRFTLVKNNLSHTISPLVNRQTFFMLIVIVRFNNTCMPSIWPCHSLLYSPPVYAISHICIFLFHYILYTIVNDL